MVIKTSSINLTAVFTVFFCAVLQYFMALSPQLWLEVVAVIDNRFQRQHISSNSC